MSEVDIGVPKGMRRRDYMAGFEHGRQSAYDDYEGELRRLDLLEIYEIHIEQLDHTRKSQRGMLKKQGKEIIALRKRVEGLSGAMDSMSRTNGRLARAFNTSSEVLWRVAGLSTNDTSIVRIRDMARKALGQRIRDENR